MQNVNPARTRRQVLRGALLLAGASVLSACAAPSQNRTPVMQFIYPDRQGARVQHNPVNIRVQVRDFPPLTESLYRDRETQARVVFFIDTPADAVADGQPIPNDPLKFVPATQPPYTEQAIQMTPGIRTITAVMVDRNGNKLPQPAPVAMTVFVQPGSFSTR
jgi:hypothetical protein